MKIIKKISDWEIISEELKKSGKTIGFVPTMGALHRGHLSLIEASKNETEVSIISIFVNPTQFNDPKDYEKYPQVLDLDVEKMAASGVDYVFAPSVVEMYPSGLSERIAIDLGFLDQTLEGAMRPGHYSGVCTVLHRFFTIIPANKVFMGLKDYQQVMVVKKLTEVYFPKIEIVGCPTLREPNGLAMSSRNERLSPENKEKASAIYAALKLCKKLLDTKPISESIKEAKETYLSSKDFEIEYFEVRNAETLAEIPSDLMVDTKKVVVLIAVWLGGVRLIDNL